MSPLVHTLLGHQCLCDGACRLQSLRQHQEHQNYDYRAIDGKEPLGTAPSQKPSEDTTDGRSKKRSKQRSKGIDSHRLSPFLDMPDIRDGPCSDGLYASRSPSDQHAHDDEHDGVLRQRGKHVPNDEENERDQIDRTMSDCFGERRPPQRENGNAEEMEGH